jgi:hemerythrin-like domain-containing protein
MQDDGILLEKFADVLEKHIRFEERELFNYMQETLSETDCRKSHHHLHQDCIIDNLCIILN